MNIFELSRKMVEGDENIPSKFNVNEFIDNAIEIRKILDKYPKLLYVLTTTNDLTASEKRYYGDVVKKIRNSKMRKRRR